MKNTPLNKKINFKKLYEIGINIAISLHCTHKLTVKDIHLKHDQQCRLVVLSTFVISFINVRLCPTVLQKLLTLHLPVPHISLLCFWLPTFIKANMVNKIAPSFYQESMLNVPITNMPWAAEL